MSDLSLVEISGKQKQTTAHLPGVILSVAELRSSDEHASRDLGQEPLKFAALARVILSGAKRSRTRRAMSDVSLVEISGK